MLLKFMFLKCLHLIFFLCLLNISSTIWGTWEHKAHTTVTAPGETVLEMCFYEAINISPSATANDLSSRKKCRFMASYKAYSAEYKQAWESQPAGDRRNSFGRCSSHGPLLKTWFNFLSYKTYRWVVSFRFCEHSCEFKFATFYAQYTCLFVVLKVAVTLGSFCFHPFHEKNALLSH